MGSRPHLQIAAGHPLRVFRAVAAHVWGVDLGGGGHAAETWHNDHALPDAVDVRAEVVPFADPSKSG